MILSLEDEYLGLSSKVNSEWIQDLEHLMMYFESCLEEMGYPKGCIETIQSVVAYSTTRLFYTFIIPHPDINLNMGEFFYNELNRYITQTRNFNIDNLIRRTIVVPKITGDYESRLFFDRYHLVIQFIKDRRKMGNDWQHIWASEL